MTHCCCVFGCKSRRKKGITNSPIKFYRIPAIYSPTHVLQNKLSSQRQEAWLRAIKRNDITESNFRSFRVCSRHFLSEKPAHLKDKEHPDWVPSVNMGYRTSLSGKQVHLNRYERRLKRINPNLAFIPSLPSAIPDSKSSSNTNNWNIKMTVENPTFSQQLWNLNNNTKTVNDPLTIDNKRRIQSDVINQTDPIKSVDYRDIYQIKTEGSDNVYVIVDVSPNDFLKEDTPAEICSTNSDNTIENEKSPNEESNDDDDVDDSTDLIFKTFAQIVKSFSPCKQARIKHKITALLMEEA